MSEVWFSLSVLHCDASGSRADKSKIKYEATF